MIVFLDIDGVLCTRKAAGWPQRPGAASPRGVRTGIRRPARAIDRHAVALLNRTLERIDGVVVIASMWRLRLNGQEIRARTGLADRLHADWRTDALGPTRGHEVQRWLQAHDLPRFAMVDDQVQVLPQQLGRLVLTRNYEGFAGRDAAALLSLATHP